MRVAIVDIGTNSTRLLICDVEGERVSAELERMSEVTRLGQGVDAAGRLSEEAMERVYRVLGRYGELIEHHGAGRRLAVLTSAVRDAANGADFARTVRERFQLAPHVLRGEAEARLTFLGATSERDPADPTPTLVIDVGGGSTELVIGEGHTMSFHVSTQAGVVRQSERHLASDPPAEGELRELAADVRQTLESAVPAAQRARARHAIAVAGTATSLAAIAQALEPYDPARAHGYRLTRGEAEAIFERLRRLPLAERRRVPGLHPDRAPTILAGVVILLEVMALFGLQAAEVSEHDILRGAALGLSET